MRKGFVFDMNKCVGCQACVIACQIENHAVQSEPWRTVSTFNAFQHPLLPLFHFSLACNHCEIPLCLTHCPSRAYRKNASLQTIDHDADRCIGCRYCTWACPYDAPRFIHARGVVEKCTLCKTRIEEGLKPNCANLCPTGALDFDRIDEGLVNDVPGFVEKGIKPGLKIIPIRKTQRKLRHPVAPYDRDVHRKLYEELTLSSSSKSGLLQEWPLVVFTVLASVLFGIFAASMFKSVVIDPLTFLAAGIAGMIVSTFHLGRKLRAWKALLNLRSSWLSREIGAYLLFLLFSALSFVSPEAEVFRLATLITGLATLISVDLVYAIAENRSAFGLSSASAVLTGILFFSAFGGLWWPFVVITGLKFTLYGTEFVRANRRNALRNVLSVVRIVAGFFVPIALLGSVTGRSAAAILLLIAEIVNRSEFYVDLEILTPRRQIANDLAKELRHQMSPGGMS